MVWLPKFFRHRNANRKPYTVYTREFDREATAVKLFEKESIDVLHKPSVQDLKTAAPNTNARLEAEFANKWTEGHNLGLNPLITLLIDHSGSMKGERALHAASSALSIGRLLDGLHIKFEILGFTTTSWRGGNARKKWLNAGAPRNPGRLCDLLHIIYHDAENSIESWEKGLALYNFPHFYKENIDGEALIWAQDRALRQHPTGWLCIVISDGVSVDDSTIAANNGPKTNWYLGAHLSKVIQELSTESRFKVAGLGVEQKVDEYYAIHETADKPVDIGERALVLLNRMIDLTG